MSEFQQFYAALADMQRIARQITGSEDAYVRATLTPEGPGYASVFLPNDPEYQHEPDMGIVYAKWLTPEDMLAQLQETLTRIKTG